MCRRDLGEWHCNAHANNMVLIPPPPEVVGAAGEGVGPQDASGSANIVPNSLETSNSSLSQSIPELSLSQKFFQSISKVLHIDLQNQDTVISLIK